MTRRIFFLPGNQLYAPSLLKPYRDALFVMTEDEGVCRRRRYHQQKLGLVIAAMREHAEALRRAGFEVRYSTLAEEVSIADALAGAARRVGAQ